ncbi:MAG TPA: GDYXXLXY domain-containing protein [Chitinophagales bacterium]|nr:GDYXXLXY domain-containing protein [Chitinophagales bacterium]
MKKYSKLLIALNLLLLLGFFINSVIKKEATLKNGQLVLLELAPVDPRSLLQGDYMRLRYRLVAERTYALTCRPGVCTVIVNDSSIVKQMILPGEKDTIAGKPYLLKYGCNGDEVHLGAESYFFEEGQAEKYSKAKYGGLRIDEAGNSILVGLYNENRRLIE